MANQNTLLMREGKQVFLEINFKYAIAVDLTIALPISVNTYAPFFF